ncbi:MAG: TOBE domain-containing protein, partial [Cellvibrionales bacterium]|nr:TOBE domain-containing protein [Cellvibrionales bacterium]
AMRVLVRPEEVRFAADGAVAGRIERKQFMGAG